MGHEMDGETAALLTPWWAARHPKRTWRWLCTRPQTERIALLGWVLAADIPGIATSYLETEGAFGAVWRAEQRARRAWHPELERRNNDAVTGAGMPIERDALADGTAPEVAAELAAAAAARRPEYALDLAVAATHSHAWEDLEPAVALCVERLEAPDRARLAELARRPALVVDTANWTALAARAGVLDPIEARQQVEELCHRITDELDPDRFWRAALPALRAAVHVNHLEAVAEFLPGGRIRCTSAH